MQPIFSRTLMKFFFDNCASSLICFFCAVFRNFTSTIIFAKFWWFRCFIPMETFPFSTESKCTEPEWSWLMMNLDRINWLLFYSQKRVKKLENCFLSLLRKDRCWCKQFDVRMPVLVTCNAQAIITHKYVLKCLIILRTAA